MLVINSCGFQNLAPSCLVVILFGMFLNVSVAKMGVDLKFDFTYILVTCMPAQFACFDPPPLFLCNFKKICTCQSDNLSVGQVLPPKYL